MADVTVMSQPVLAQTKSTFTPIISQTHISNDNHDVFTPAKHLDFNEMPTVHTMKELGFTESTGVSPIAVSEPFKLFTEEAVMRMRQEVLSPEVFENCQYSSNLAHCYLRGFANKYAPFVYDVWKNPETLAIVSKIAGIDLVPEMDLEIAHINISVKSEDEKREELEAVAERANYEADEGIGGCPWEDDKPIVGWHTDSYPFVCVTMLSDCTDMVGGETALRTGNGDIMKVRGPQMARLRSSVTGQIYRAPSSSDPGDDTVLTTVRPISNINDLYNQFAEYRLQMLEERIRLQLKEIHDLSAAGRRVSTKKLKSFFEEQEKFLAHMNKEMVDDEDVVVGNIQQDHITPTTPSKSKKRHALRLGCRLCIMVQESISYRDDKPDGFPYHVRYAFKALNPCWARDGTGPEWLVPQKQKQEAAKLKSSSEHSDDDELVLKRYLHEVDKDPTPNGLGSLLAADADEVVNEARKSWLVLEFYGPGAHVVLPMELATNDEMEKLMQHNMDKQASTGSNENLELANAWLQKCLTSHDACGPSQPGQWLPKRLIDVGTATDETIRLVLGRSLDTKSPYAALSYRWGENTSFVLTSAKLVAYQKEMPLSHLSSTLKDAIKVTRALGLRYLWMDSVCIVQDDPDDWARESAIMAKIYGLSACTIVAASSGSFLGGMFATRNQYQVRPCRIPNPFCMNSRYSFYVKPQYLYRIHDREVKRSGWYNRGWVFQERTLSPRLLIFSGTQILWTCEQMQAAESWPCGRTTENHIDRFESFAEEKARFLKLVDPDDGVTKQHTAWFRFIKEYMNSELTVRADRLVALQGIVSLVEGYTGQSYCGGFWLNDTLPYNLLWTAQVPLLPRPTEYIAPSWSWAALNGEVQLNSRNLRNSVEMIQILGIERIRHIAVQADRNTREALRIAGMLLPLTTVNTGLYEEASRVKPESRKLPKVYRLRNGLRKFFAYLDYLIRAEPSQPPSHFIRERRKRVTYEVDFRRRQREVEARTQRVFEDLERGVKFQEIEEDLIERKHVSGIKNIQDAICFLDTPMDKSCVTHVLCLPVIRASGETSGLLVHPAAGKAGHYERLGTFRIPSWWVRQQPQPKGEEVILLV
ncbi:hypothetical protein O1611_g3038 [Lasiodiplodia mahajangana]|uniref:Uncharacterized protein n=1 Tax=Lasiodiplodia mahajangana TaxID=1108764 RepID=A0ACC2JT75_9PEZI|nr:hypothetical protein O1611_g3038 [Lasiodiplodia mahajangana]